MTQTEDVGMIEQRIDRWNALIEKYKFLHFDRVSMVFRYQCGVGWMPILEHLFAEIEREARSANLTEITILQIKEKFGDLVVDVGNGNNDVDELIKAAIKKASVTCEGCGKSGKKTDCDGWYKTMCSKCYSKRDW